MKRTIFPVLLLILLVNFFPPQLCVAAKAGSLEDYISGADIIVEGRVIEHAPTANRKIQGYVGPAKEPVFFDLGHAIESHFQITRVFKGNAREKKTIRVFAYPEIPEDVTEFSVNDKYIIFLKERKLQDGYTVLDQGRGLWLVFDHNGISKIKPRFQPPMVRSADAYQDYSDFINTLQQNLSRE